MQSEDTDLVKGDLSHLTHLHLPIITAGHESCLSSNYCNYACMVFIDYTIKTKFFYYYDIITFSIHVGTVLDNLL